MGIRGDFAGLSDLQRRIAVLGTPSARADLNAALAETVRTLILEEFDASSGPYGAPWLSLRRRSGKPLLDTGRLRSSFNGDGSDAKSFRFGTDVVYAGVHQYGTATVPQRQIMPEDELPERWLSAFEVEVQSSLEESFGR